jgi:Bacterial PH domain/Short C-terminal domain
VARYADRLLADGERISLRGRQHILAPVIDGKIAWAVLIASVVLVFLSAQLQPGMPRDIFGWIGLALLVGALIWLGYIFLRWYSQEYLVTNRRVVNVSGILNKRSADSSLEKINDAVLEQSILGRMFGFGDLDILTANDQSVDRYRLLGQAQTFKKTMLEEKHRLEQEVFQVPAPPLRAAVPMPPPPVEPAIEPAAGSGGGTAVAAAPPAPTARSLTAEEITGALADLADLRDRGAISPEEYEAKKQDLLGRL